MPIDDADWHSDSVSDLGLEPLAGAIHIGIFLAWAGNRGLLANNHQDAVHAGRLRSDTPSAYAERFFVSQFGPWDLTEEGQKFTASEYKTYLKDSEGLSRLLDPPAPSAYEVPDTWETYDLWSQYLDELYARWLPR